MRKKRNKERTHVRKQTMVSLVVRVDDRLVHSRVKQQGAQWPVQRLVVVVRERGWETKRKREEHTKRRAKREEINKQKNREKRDKNKKILRSRHPTKHPTKHPQSIPTKHPTTKKKGTHFVLVGI